MTNTSGRAAILILTSVAVLVVLVWALSYHTFEFRGGISIRDSGFFSYPRYHAELGEIPLWKDGKYQFSVRGLPSDPLDLSLRIRDSTYNDATQLASLSTSVGVSVTDASGQVICAANGKLADSKLRGKNSWVLASSSSNASFWHPSCQQLPISRSKTYTVKLSLADVDARSPHKIILAVLQGGGVELP